LNDQRVSKMPGRMLLISAGLLMLSILGCDQIEASKALVENTLSEFDETATAEQTAAGDPDMDSIGPDGAMRIYYQFVDGSGQVQFVERITDVPVAWREQVGFVEMSQPPPLTPLAARRSWRLSSERTSQILAANASATSVSSSGRAQTEDVILYFATWCGYCKQAKAHLERAGVEYDLRDVDNGWIKEELLEKTGRSGIPVLDFSGEILRGYSAERYDKVISTIRG
jgi:glutaredoxin